MEDSDLEFKRKEKLESSRGRQDVVQILSAMANTRGGGTMVCGIGQADGGVVIQSFDAASELKRDLENVAHDRTQPSLVHLVEMRWERVRGARLLRIDVRESVDEVISFKRQKGDGSVEWSAFHRIGSTTRAMTPQEITERAQLRRPAPNHDGLIASITPTLEPARVRRTLTSPIPHRVLTESHPDSQPIFGMSHLEDFDRPSFYRLETYIQLQAIDDWQHLTATIGKYTGLDFESRFCYSIQEGGRVLCGASSTSLLQDVANIEQVGRSMSASPPRVPPRLDRRFLPLVTGYIPFRSGFFWFQAEWQGHAGFWSREKCGMALSNLPFDDSEIRALFKELGGMPGDYEQTKSTSGLVIRQRVNLRRPRLVVLDPEDDYMFVEADNPYFRKAKEVLGGREDSATKWMVDYFCEIPRLIFQVAGGGVGSDRKFSLSQLTIDYLPLRLSTLFINGIVHASS